jgi:monoamine oxidase
MAKTKKIHSLEPAASIISRLGGPAATARAAGVHANRPYRWMSPQSIGGTGGLVPQRHHRKLLDWAKSAGIELTPAMLVGVESVDGPAKAA